MTERATESEPIVVTVGGVAIPAEPAAAGRAVSYAGTVDLGPGAARRRARVRIRVELLAERDDDHDTFLGRGHGELLGDVGEAAVVRVVPNKGGGGLSFRLDLAAGTRACFKPDQINRQTTPRKEVFAYRLARLLGRNNVPPTCLRSLHRDELLGRLPADLAFFLPRILAETIFDEHGATTGSASAWVPILVDSELDTRAGMRRWWHALCVDAPLDADQKVYEELSALLLFDVTIDNFDRFSGNNLLFPEGSGLLLWMDNSIGLGEGREPHPRCRDLLARCQRFPRSFVDALRSLDRRAMNLCLSPEHDLLTETEIDAVLHRRDVAIAHVDTMIGRFGEERVLSFT
jgi:hypothetical protein